ncbi:unnamed protein product [Rangifer tarandus platyrhynchus]|uniref:Uncharacterized protein n=1 Tax=Rangifer tarandus platyrhynchus TaxID=3082113 RepID=A0AC59ZVI6_RANTA
MDCVVHGVAESQTRLSDFRFPHFSGEGSCRPFPLHLGGAGDRQVCKPRAPRTRPRLSLGIWGAEQGFRGSPGPALTPAARSPCPAAAERPAGLSRWTNGLHAVPPAATGGQCALRNGQGACVRVRACACVRECVCA